MEDRSALRNKKPPSINNYSDKTKNILFVLRYIGQAEQ